MTVATAPHDTALDLRQSFEAFNQISAALESAYDRLRTQAAAVDVALAESNRRLADKVAELDATGGHLKAVLESMQSAVVVTDAHGIVTLVNPAFERLSGAPARELCGKPRGRLRDDRGEPLCSRADACSAPRSVVVHGQQRLVRSTRSPIRDRDQHVLGFVEVIQDDTEVEGLRQELRRRETLAALGEMAAGIAHEIRNPMVAIEGFASLLLHGLAPGEQAARGQAQRILRGVRRANNIITNLLCLARPESFRPRRARVAEILEALRGEFLGAEAPLPEIAAPAPRGELRCDPLMIEQVLINLVVNARQAAGPRGHVHVHAQVTSGEVAFHVRDDGPGVAPELEDRMFLPFVTRRPEGTGLGLSIAHRIVDLHGGRIEVAAAPGRGSIFTVRLPAPRRGELEKETA